MLAKIPNWLISTKRVNSKSCICIYKDNLGNKLGAPRRYRGKRKISFDRCMAEVKQFNFSGQEEYRKERKPHWPSNPNVYYKDKWKGWSHFLGRSIVAFLPFDKCKEEVAMCKFKSRSDYRNNRNPNWPVAPNVAYKDQWINWYDFLGKKRKT
jgi:hypothetical protein